MARNPFRSEAEAYRFLLLTVVYFALIVVAASIETWLGLVVFIVLTALAFGPGCARARRSRPSRRPCRTSSAEDERRILVIANETVGGAGAALDPALEGGGRAASRCSSSARRSTRRPPLGLRRGRRARGGPGAARREPARLREDGIQAQGEVGDGDPLQAMEDALRTFGADEIVISTHPEGRSNWLERNVVGAARERFDVPITHVVVDLEASAR